MWGDKDTFELAFKYVGTTYYQNKYNVNIAIEKISDRNVNLVCFYQPNPETGESLFVHRVGGNGRLDLDKYSKTKDKYYIINSCKTSVGCDERTTCNKLGCNKNEIIRILNNGTLIDTFILSSQIREINSYEYTILSLLSINIKNLLDRLRQPCVYKMNEYYNTTIMPNILPDTQSIFYMRLIYPAYLLSKNLRINYQMIKYLTPIFNIYKDNKLFYQDIYKIQNYQQIKNIVFDIDPFEIYFKHIDGNEQELILDNLNIKDNLDMKIQLYYIGSNANYKKYLKYKNKYLQLKSEFAKKNLL
jgi:hypothetical protein